MAREVMSVAVFLAIARIIIDWIKVNMETTRRIRDTYRELNTWVNWDDEESKGCEGEDIFAERNLFDRSEQHYYQEEMWRFLCGAHFQGGIGPDTARAQWIRGLREERRHLDDEAEDRMENLDIDDRWDLRILFGDQPKDAEPRPEDVNWELELWD